MSKEFYMNGTVMYMCTCVRPLLKYFSVGNENVNQQIPRLLADATGHKSLVSSMLEVYLGGL